MKNRLRCLLLDNNVSYVNPTRRLLVDVLRRASELSIFGPGYVSAKEFEAGIERFADRHGPFDVVIATEQLLLPHYYPRERLLSGVWNAHAYNFPTEWMTAKVPFDFLRTFGNIRIISFLQTDFYSVRPVITDLVDQAGAYVIGAGPEFLGQYRDDAPSSLHRRGSDAWFEFIERSKNKVISLGHFVSEGEISRRPLARRRYDASIPGANYNERLAAKEKLQASGQRVRIPSAVSERNVLRLRNYLKLESKHLGILFLNKYFHRLLSNSRVVFTSPGALGYAIRKYFEIPAAGAVMACVPCRAFEALGFREGENAILCDPADLPALAEKVRRDPDAFQEIADAGRTLVERKHSVQARADQIRQALTAIQNQKYRGSEWRNGEFHLID
jgi:hypothetical protein